MNKKILLIFIAVMIMFLIVTAMPKSYVSTKEKFLIIPWPWELIWEGDHFEMEINCENY